MSFSWEQAFTKATGPRGLAGRAKAVKDGGLPALKDFLDLAHIKYALLQPYFETANYPVVETANCSPPSRWTCSSTRTCPASPWWSCRAGSRTSRRYSSTTSCTPRRTSPSPSVRPTRP